MNPKLVQEALGRRKAQALDITILLGTPDGNVQQIGSLGGADDDSDVTDEDGDEEDKAEARKLDMAPDAPELGKEQEMKDQALGRIGHNQNFTPGAELMNAPDGQQDQALIQQELAKLQLGKNSLSARAAKKY